MVPMIGVSTGWRPRTYCFRCFPPRKLLFPTTALLGTIIYPLTLILLTCTIWWAPNNDCKWQMVFNSPFKGLNAQLNPMCRLLALLGAHHILHVSRIGVKVFAGIWWCVGEMSGSPTRHHRHGFIFRVKQPNPNCSRAQRHTARTRHPQVYRWFVHYVAEFLIYSTRTIFPLKTRFPVFSLFCPSLI